MKTGTIVVWLRNDLRIHDNEVLTRAIKNSELIIPIYCIDPRLFKLTSFGTRKTGSFRAQFLLNTLTQLRKSIHNLGGKLLVEYGLPELVITDIAKKYNAKSVYAQKEITQEEIEVENSLEKELWKHKINLELIWGNTLYHKEDIPFSIKDIPDIFTQFRKKVETESIVRAILPTPHHIIVPKELIEKPLPTLKKLGLTIEKKLLFDAGEEKAMERLHYYFWESHRIKTYKETRNNLLGNDFSTKFSPWLANGSLSPRYIYHEIKKYEVENGANNSTYWLIFELLWRDYFKFVFKKYSNKLFTINGIKATSTSAFNESKTDFENWKNGKTGIPFIDANMAELANTGFMSNRGRQNVASYLVHDLKINWLYGAAYFEEQLIDYDVCSNYGNWAYIAGVGNDPRENRKFNIEKQAKEYDPFNEFINFWLPKIERPKAYDVQKKNFSIMKTPLKA